MDNALRYRGGIGVRFWHVYSGPSAVDVLRG